MATKHQTKNQSYAEADALFLGDGVRSIARKTLPPGFTLADLSQFLRLLYGLFDEKEAKMTVVTDPFASGDGRRVTAARLADALANLIAAHADNKSA